MVKCFRLGAVVLAAALAAGCAGSKGDPGPAGATGATGGKGDKGDPGAPGQPTLSTTEKCYGCHGGTVAASHATRNLLTVRSETALSAVDPDLLMTFNVKVDGVNRNDFLNKVSGYTWTYDPANVTTPGGVRTTLATTSYTVTSLGAGNYNIRVLGFGPGGATPAAAGTMFMFRLEGRDSAPQATVVSTFGTRTHAVVSNQACMNCHGEYVFHELNALGLPTQHHGANPKGVDACVFCHNRYDSSESRLGTSGTTGTGTGTRLMGYVHGIHNSHNMSAGMGEDLNPDLATTLISQNAEGTYARNGSTSASSQFSIGFPGYMMNCSTCHAGTAELAAINAAPVSWKLCMSCHNDWDGFAATRTGETMATHRAYRWTTACTNCHGTPGVFGTVAEAHNPRTNHPAMKTERNGLVYNGADQSVVLGPKVRMQITGVSADPEGAGTILVTWTATQDLDGNGTFTAVDPCNFDVTAGPVFLVTTANAATGQVAHNMSMIRGYAYSTSDDWTGGASASNSPGQPSSQNLTAVGNSRANGFTSCAANVATTKLRAETTAAVKGVIGLQGKPQVRFGAIVAAAIGTNYEVIQVRSESPTFTYNPQTLGAVAARRMTVDNAKCLDCHLGSLYQHGGNRVDSVALCDVCHNPAASEGNNRANYGVTPAEAYDGKAGETYDMRTMVHAIHSAGETGKLLVYYRSNGIYAFGTAAAIAAIPNWKTTPSISCTGDDGHGGFGVLTSYMVYGSDNAVAFGNANVPVNAGAVTFDPADTCSSTPVANLPAGYTRGVYRTFNEIPVHYPQPLNNCGACHADNWTPSLPNPNQAVAVTFDPGATATTAPNTLGDDVLIGPAAQSCMTCHQSGDVFLQYGLRAHAYENGWTPTVFTGGRQTLLDAVP